MRYFWRFYYWLFPKQGMKSKTAIVIRTARTQGWKVADKIMVHEAMHEEIYRGLRGLPKVQW